MKIHLDLLFTYTRDFIWNTKHTTWRVSVATTKAGELLHCTLGVPQCRSGRYGEGKISCPCPEWNPESSAVEPVARRNTGCQQMNKEKHFQASALLSKATRRACSSYGVEEWRGEMQQWVQLNFRRIHLAQVISQIWTRPLPATFFQLSQAI
jgi:hypothetical protein